MADPADPRNETIVGNWDWSKSQYEVIQTSLRQLLDKLNLWNIAAISHGAASSPYESEVRSIGTMIQWGASRLADETAHEVVVKRISVGSLRFIKAGLLYSASNFEAEALSQKSQGWPARVVDAVRGQAIIARDLALGIPYRPADVLEDLHPHSAVAPGGAKLESWDVFISHASEDKEPFVRGLADALKAAGLSVWYADFTLTVGDSLHRSIDRGLSRSKFGVVILSPSFFAKEWPQRELDGLVSREVDGKKVVLPVWHTVDLAFVRSYSPTLADKLGISSSRGIGVVAEAVLQAVRSDA